MTAETDQPPEGGLRRLIRANLTAALIEVVLPMVAFYGLRAAGVGQWWALMAGIAIVAPYLLIRTLRRRRLDLLALATLSVLVLSVVMGLLSTDPRSLAIREGWTAAVGGLIGMWMLISVIVGRPAQLVLGRTVAEAKRGEAGAQAWAARWDHDVAFRRGLRVNTAVWGAVLLGSAVIHIALVYLLPIDLIALVTNVVWFGILACLLTWHVWHVRTRDLDA